MKEGMQLLRPQRRRLAGYEMNQIRFYERTLVPSSAARQQHGSCSCCTDAPGGALRRAGAGELLAAAASAVAVVGAGGGGAHKLGHRLEGGLLLGALHASHVIHQGYHRLDLL